MTSGEGGRLGWPEVQREASELVVSATSRRAVLHLVGSTENRMHCPAAGEAMETLPWKIRAEVGERAQWWEDGPLERQHS